MNILIFDTETTSLEKPFCYNIGYVIYDTTTNTTLLKKDFVCEQVWHNIPLFNTAYYSNKRTLYIQSMRTKKATLKKFGYVCQEMIRDIKNFNVRSAYAFNSPFDTKVFEYNCEWFKCINPFENINIFDIRGYAIEFIAKTNDYKNFCDTHEYYTLNGNYSTNAETFGRYIYNDISLCEEHTALSDSELEADILIECLRLGATLDTNYNIPKCIKRKSQKRLVIEKDKQEIFNIECSEYIVYKTRDKVVVRD